METFLKPSEAYLKLGIARSTLNSWMFKGIIKTKRKNNGFHLIPISEIQRILDMRVRFDIDFSVQDQWAWWLVGFTDGEGTFSLIGNKRNGLIPKDYTARYQVFQRSDRRYFIDDIASTLKCGTVVERKSKPPAGPGVYFVVQDMKSLLNIIIPFFDKYPPRLKYKEYILWRSAIMLKKDRDNKHLEELGIIREKLRALYRNHNAF